MKNLFLNILLAFIWAAVSGAITLGNLLVGFVFGYFVLRIMRPLLGEAAYDERVYYQVRLISLFFWDLFVSSLRVALEVLTPGYGMKAGIIAIPLDVKSELGITTLANHISLTPGTLSLDVSDDCSQLFIHAMYIDKGIEEEKALLKRTAENRIIKALGRTAFEPAALEMVEKER